MVYAPDVLWALQRWSPFVVRDLWGSDADAIVTNSGAPTLRPHALGDEWYRDHCAVLCCRTRGRRSRVICHASCWNSRRPTCSASAACTPSDCSLPVLPELQPFAFCLESESTGRASMLFRQSGRCFDVWGLVQRLLPLFRLELSARGVRPVWDPPAWRMFAQLNARVGWMVYATKRARCTRCTQSSRSVERQD